MRGAVRRDEQVNGVRKGGKSGKRRKKKSLSAPGSSSEEVNLAFGEEDESEEERSWAVEEATEGAFEEDGEEEGEEEGMVYAPTQESPKKRKQPPEKVLTKERAKKVTVTKRKEKDVTPTPVFEVLREREKEVAARPRKKTVIYIELSD